MGVQPRLRFLVRKENIKPKTKMSNMQLHIKVDLEDLFNAKAYNVK